MKKSLLVIIPLLMVATVSNVYAGGPRLDYPDGATKEGADCWVDGYDAGFAGKYDKDRANECENIGDDNYNASWKHGCKNAGYMPDECEGFKNDSTDLEDHEQLQEQNRRNCYDDGYEDGQNNPFDHDRDNGCSEYSSSYRSGFLAGCESVEGNTYDNCELTIRGHENYCPNNPDNPSCTEFLHDASNKRPPESGPVCGQEPSHPGCFKNQDPEKYCLNHNDQASCKGIGDICDIGGFVKPEDAYCKQN